jgi:hypothetical protein
MTARIVAEILGFLRDLLGEGAYHRYPDGRRRRRFPEGSIVTRLECERRRTETQEHNPDIQCRAPRNLHFERVFTFCI